MAVTNMRFDKGGIREYCRGMDEKTPLDRAIEAAGGVKPLAIALGITPEAIYVWERVPVMRVLDVERITGVSRYELRPDMYPRDHDNHRAAE